jgi:uncharacterized protein
VAKIILLVLALLFVYWILRSYRRRVDRRGQQPPAGGAETMVQCAHCGLHLPRSDSVAGRDRFFCSDDHQRAHSAGRHSG